MTPEQRNLVALHGLCDECGAPRSVTQSSNPDTHAVTMSLVCTEDERHDA